MARRRRRRLHRRCSGKWSRRRGRSRGARPTYLRTRRSESRCVWCWSSAAACVRWTRNASRRNRSRGQRCRARTFGGSPRSSRRLARTLRGPPAPWLHVRELDLRDRHVGLARWSSSRRLCILLIRRRGCQVPPAAPPAQHWSLLAKLPRPCLKQVSRSQKGSGHPGYL
ncbi:hypothetical protein BJ742DRAFT_787139 [Cladochytrium replicatum]|nr:hypothetical protein BJ742DRAFT_787139 [Cladochytrium replicatum]